MLTTSIQALALNATTNADLTWLVAEWHCF